MEKIKWAESRVTKPSWLHQTFNLSFYVCVSPLSKRKKIIFFNEWRAKAHYIENNNKKRNQILIGNLANKEDDMITTYPNIRWTFGKPSKSRVALLSNLFSPSNFIFCPFPLWKKCCKNKTHDARCPTSKTLFGDWSCGPPPLFLIYLKTDLCVVQYIKKKK